MAIEVLALTIDCADAGLLAQFWAEALGRTVNPGATAQSARIAAVDAAKTGPMLSFQKVPEGKTVKNRVHLDLGTTQMEAETERLLGLGATKLWDAEKGSTRWTTFADPEGNEFDLIAR